MMREHPDLAAIDCKVKHLQQLLGNARLTSIDFDNREHLHAIQLCLDIAIDRIKKIK